MTPTYLPLPYAEEFESWATSQGHDITRSEQSDGVQYCGLYRDARTCAAYLRWAFRGGKPEQVPAVAGTALCDETDFMTPFMRAIQFRRTPAGTFQDTSHA